MLLLASAFPAKMSNSTSTNQFLAKQQMRRMSFLALSFLMWGCLVGCRQVRLPAIDPTGSSIFAPKPYTTTLTVPGFGDEKCGVVDHFKNHFAGLGFGNNGMTFPDPVFKGPGRPEPCPPDGVLQPNSPELGASIGTADTSLVSMNLSNAACPSDGPAAVLYGSQKVQQTRRLPCKGNRGSILLTPSKIVAPVGGEVVLLSGICGTDGYLQLNEKLEWMLTPDSVGTFIEVGENAPGVLTRMVVSKTKPQKQGPTYAIGMTSTKEMLITRGNRDVRDDVHLQKGQTWITVSSPSEGVSHVTVLAPESECWDQRKATATIYWVDAKWQFPSRQVVPKGQPVTLSTKVSRSEGGAPARGWKVRYEMLQPGIATFAGTDGATVTEAAVDEQGVAAVQLVPASGSSGTTAVSVQVIRPGGLGDRLPSVTLGRGETTVTWSAPKLTLRAGAPAVATFDSPFEVIANLANAGDQPATNVRVDVQLPPGTRVVRSDAFARVLPNAVTWDIGALPPQQQLDLFLEVATQSPVDLVYQARGDGLLSEDTVRIDVFQPSLSVDIKALLQRVESGQSVVYDIDVTNSGDRPLTNLQLVASGDSGMIHQSGNAAVANQMDNGPLQPGQTWSAQVQFIPVQAGQRCLTVEATADGGQRMAQESCVTVINPIPRTPDLQVSLDGPSDAVLGQEVLLRATISNNGPVVANQVRAVIAYPAQLQLKQATQGADQAFVQQRQIAWNLLQLNPGQKVVLEAQFDTVFPVNQVESVLQVGADVGDPVVEKQMMTIRPAGSSVTPNGTGSAGQPNPAVLEVPDDNRGPSLPLRGNSMPERDNGTPDRVGEAAPDAFDNSIGEAVSGGLQVSLLARDNPVSVGSPIRYRLKIINDSTERDSDLTIQFRLPDGLRLDRVSRSTNPEVGEFQIGAGALATASVPSIEPGEQLDYEIVLIGNQPTTFDFTIDVKSYREEEGVQRTSSTTVVP